MIALPSIAFGGFSGSAKDVTARQVGSRTILSVKSWPGGFTTNPQAIRRSALTKISKTYRALSDEQMRGWEQLASHSSGASSLGEKSKISGHNMFVRLNANRAYIGEGILYDAPEYDFDLPTVQFEDIWVTPPVVLISGIEYPKDNLRLVVKMSDAISPGVSVGWSKTVIVAPNMVPDWGEVDVTALYTKTLGIEPVPGYKYFVEMYWIDADTGFTGVPLQVEVVATEDTSRGGQVYNGPRVRIIKGQNLTTEDGSFREFDLELSKGSAYVSIEAKLYLDGNMHVGPAYIDPVPPVFDTFGRGMRFGSVARPSDLEEDERVVLYIFTSEWYPDVYSEDKRYRMTVKVPDGISIGEVEYEIFDTSMFVYKNGE